jgi:PAS domain S-box-containing protein
MNTIDKTRTSIQQQFRNMIMQAPVAMCMLRGPTYIMEVVNEKMLEIFGKRAEEVINRPLFEVLPNADEQGYEELLDSVYNTGKSFTTYESPVEIDRTGKLETIYVNFVYEPFREDGKIIGIMVVAIEVTEQINTRKKIEQSEKQLHKELIDVQQLNKISTQLISEDNIDQLYQLILETAKVIMESDYASIQLWLPENNELLLLAWQNFHPDSAAFWKKVSIGEASSCGMALQNKQQVIVTDIEKCDFMAGTEDLYYYRLSGIRAVQSTPLVSRDGHVVGMISTHWKKVHNPSERNLKLFDVLARQATDLIERKQAEEKIKESEERFRLLAESLPQLVWVTDEKGKYEFVSKEWTEYSGVHCNTMDKWESLVHPDDFENIANLWKNSISSGEVYKGEVRIKNKAGEYRWHSAIGELVLDNENRIIKWVGAFTDIDVLKREQQRKDSFMSMASHELRTPITTIKAYGEIAEMMLIEKDDEQTLAIQKKMSKQVNRLTMLITDLLDNIRIQNGKLICKEVFYNFNDLVHEVVDDLQKMNPAYRINLNTAKEATVFGDKEKIGQVINNLITNAEKYSPGTSEIIVNTEVQKEGVQLSVKDFGIGIPVSEQQLVFEQFYRVNGDSQSTFPGMGIGLYICAEIISRQAGKIWLESTIGKGSTFYIWLPLDNRIENQA